MSLSAIEPLAAVENGDRASFESEALVHIDRLHRVASRLVGHAADADDLVQDTLFRAYRAWHQYQPGTNALGWLITIMRRLFINECRRRSWRREILSRGFASEAPPDHPTLVFSEAPVADEVLHAIAELPLRYREVVTLRDVEDLRYEEIATILGVRIGTVKSRLFRARSLLKLRLHAYAIDAGVLPARSSGQRDAP